ncbi:MAG: hypothetical protein ACP5IF_06605, partial [Conexivisphaera sp.]
GIDVTYSHPFIKAWGKSVYPLPEESEFYYHCFPQTPNIVITSMVLMNLMLAIFLIPMVVHL